MPGDESPAAALVYDAGDILVARLADGDYEVLRVSANGRSTHVMGVQGTQLAALQMARRATSGRQRVFLKSDGPAAAYDLVAEGTSRG